MDDEKYDRGSLFRRGFSRLGKWMAEAVEKKLDVVPRTTLRPPGALVESLFLSTCEGSGACAAACPYGSIKISAGGGLHADNTPQIQPAQMPCYLCIDVPCARACPSGALTPIRREQVKMGVAVVVQDACFAWQGTECRICVDQCPIGKSALIQVDGGGPRVIDQGCTGCGVCTNVCPARPRAIRIKPL